MFDLLAEQESVLFTCKPHLGRMLIKRRPLWLALLCLAATVGMLFYWPRFWWIPAAGSGLFLLGLVPALLNRAVTRYVLTNRRVLVQSGIVGRDYNSIPYRQITEVKVDVGIWDQLLGCGDLIICTETGEHQLLYVKAPYKFSAQLQQASDVSVPK